jgi:hypothetical protein
MPFEPALYGKGASKRSYLKAGSPPLEAFVGAGILPPHTVNRSANLTN